MFLVECAYDLAPDTIQKHDLDADDESGNAPDVDDAERLKPTHRRQFSCQMNVSH